ncbi:hypothetical protein GCM10027614_00210 [Micromonospora vulcania]
MLREAKNLKAGGVDVAGTGPFVLDRYVPGQELHYRRNPGYDWAPPTATHTGPAYLDEITYRFLKESAVRVGALRSNQVQVVEGVPATDQPQVTANPKLRLIRELNSGSAYSYYLNTSRAPSTICGSGRRSGRPSTSTPCSRRSTGTPPPAPGAWSARPARSMTSASRAATAATPPRRTACSTRPAGLPGRRRLPGARRQTTHRTAGTGRPYVRDRRDVLAQAVQAAVKQSAGIDLKVSWWTRAAPPRPSNATSTRSSTTPAPTPTPGPR